MKAVYSALLFVFMLMGLSIPVFSSPRKPPLFTLDEASYMLFHHFDDEHQISVWEHIPFPTVEEKKEFLGKETGVVSVVYFSPFLENGEYKYFLLTKTSPVGEPFNCHACLPLLSAAIFSMKNGRWMIEAKNLFLIYAGEYASAPKTKLIALSHYKHGLLLEFVHYGDGAFKERMVLIPSGQSIKLKEIKA